MNQHPVAGVVAERVIDLLEAVQIDVKDSQTTAVLFRATGRLLNLPIEIPPVRQSRQVVMQGRVFYTCACDLQRLVARLRKVFRVFQFLLKLDILGHIPVRADEPRHAGHVRVRGGAAAQMPDLPVAPDDAECIGEIRIVR